MITDRKLLDILGHHDKNDRDLLRYVANGLQSYDVNQCPVDLFEPALLDQIHLIGLRSNGLDALNIAIEEAEKEAGASDEIVKSNHDLYKAMDDYEFDCIFPEYSNLGRLYSMREDLIKVNDILDRYSKGILVMLPEVVSVFCSDINVLIRALCKCYYERCDIDTYIEADKRIDLGHTINEVDMPRMGGQMGHDLLGNISNPICSGGKLLGWKSIAEYLGRSEATAKRMGKEGLPVRKLMGSMIAWTSEIDQWLRDSSTKKRY